MSPKLWQSIADHDPFRQEDPRALSLCWNVFLMVLSEAYDHESSGSRHRTVWFEAAILDRRVAVKAVAHPGDFFEAVMTLLCADELDPFSHSSAIGQPRLQS